MTSLPERPDLGQLRTRAKELKRGVTAGEPDAHHRVLANHPKYAAGPPGHLEPGSFTLRDAQVTVARELGSSPGRPW